MQFRVEIHSDDLTILRKHYDTDWRVYVKYFDNESGRELTLDEVLPKSAKR